MFAIFVTFNIVAALLALFVLKPMRAKHFAKTNELYPAATAPMAGPRTT